MNVFAIFESVFKFHVFPLCVFRFESLNCKLMEIQPNEKFVVKIIPHALCMKSQFHVKIYEI